MKALLVKFKKFQSCLFLCVSFFKSQMSIGFCHLLFLHLLIWPCYFSFLSVDVKNYINWSLNIEWTSHTKVNPNWLWCIIHFMHCWTPSTNNLLRILLSCLWIGLVKYMGIFSSSVYAIDFCLNFSVVRKYYQNIWSICNFLPNMWPIFITSLKRIHNFQFGAIVYLCKLYKV